MMQSETQTGAEAAVMPVERLLLAAAEFEPKEPVPGELSSAGVALLLAKEASRRRRTVRARVAAFSGMLAGAGACSASLVMALTTSRPRPPQATTAPALTAVARAAEQVEQPPAPAPPAKSVLAARRPAPRRVVRRRQANPAAMRPAPPPPAPAVPVWTEETVQHQVTGLLADAWVVHQSEDGTLVLAPAVLDVPLETTQSVLTCENALSPGVAGEPLE